MEYFTIQFGHNRDVKLLFNVTILKPTLNPKLLIKIWENKVMWGRQWVTMASIYSSLHTCSIWIGLHYIVRFSCYFVSWYCGITCVLQYYCFPWVLWICRLLPPQFWWSAKWWIMDCSSSHLLFACFWHCWLGAVTWSIKDDYYVLISQSRMNDWSLAITEQDTSDWFTKSAS